jgi:hypothetical protein
MEIRILPLPLRFGGFVQPISHRLVETIVRLGFHANDYPASPVSTTESEIVVSRSRRSELQVCSVLHNSPTDDSLSCQIMRLEQRVKLGRDNWFSRTNPRICDFPCALAFNPPHVHGVAPHLPLAHRSDTLSIPGTQEQLLRRQTDHIQMLLLDAKSEVATDAAVWNPPLFVNVFPFKHHECPDGLPTGSRITVDAGATTPAMWAAVAVNQISS